GCGSGQSRRQGRKGQGGAAVRRPEPEGLLAPATIRPRQSRSGMADMNRREVVGLIAAAPLAAAFRWTPESVREASARVREALARGIPYEPKQLDRKSVV